MSLFKRLEGETWEDFGRRRFTVLARIFWANGMTSAGSILIVVTFILLLVFMFIHIYDALLKRPAHPYVGLISFMVLPAMMALGLVLLGGGLLIRRWRRQRGEPEREAVPLEGDRLLRRGLVIGLLTAVFLVLFGTFSYEAYHYTDSVGFCLKICHQVMRPEGVAYARSPHAHVACVDCHIGPGASWFVRSKLSGLRQVYAVLTDSYDRPIPTPVQDLRPARETCEVCHWPAKFQGANLRITQHYETDRANTATVTALVLKVGGLPRSGAPATGIHWHVDPRNEVRYLATGAARQDIVEVVRDTPAGEVRFLRQGAQADTAKGEWRVMDCIDCHNRPTHIYARPDEAVDAALADGLLDPSLPWLRKEGVAALRAVEPGADTAGQLLTWLTSTYRLAHPDDLPAVQDSLPRAAQVLAQILEDNVFPQMRISWGTYTSNLWHFDADGDLSSGACFRCHDEEHVSANGETISQDCDLCHTLLADREANWSGLQGVREDFLRHP
jgi:hypothetical protein